jgi:hypothetical protein
MSSEKTSESAPVHAVVMPRACWAVVDFEDTFVLLRFAKQFPDGRIAGEDGDYIVPMPGFEQSQEVWAKYNEWQFDQCPYRVSRA